MKRKLRLPPALSSSTSVPRMSEGIRSGVNWTRRASSPSAVPMVSTSLVLARPGTPTSSAWPPDSTVIKARSTTTSWPKITSPIAALAARILAAVDSAARTIMSSSFSRLSPLADAIFRFLCRAHPRSLGASPPGELPISVHATNTPSNKRIKRPVPACCRRHRRPVSWPRPNLPHIAVKLTLSWRGLGRASRRCEQLRQRRRSGTTMAKTGQGGLEAIAAALPREARGCRRSSSWNPPFCGDIDMKIAADGTWFYQKTPIGRLPLVKLFASVLKREGEQVFPGHPGREGRASPSRTPPSSPSS